MLKEAVKKMPADEADYHIKRCVASGLWVPEAKDGEQGETGPDVVANTVPDPTSTEAQIYSDLD